MNKGRSREPLRADGVPLQQSAAPAAGRPPPRPAGRASTRAAAPGRLAGPRVSRRCTQIRGAQGLPALRRRGGGLARSGRPRGGVGRGRHGLRLWRRPATPKKPGAVGGVLGGPRVPARGKGAVGQLGRSGGWPRAIYLTAVAGAARARPSGALRAAFSKCAAAAGGGELAEGLISPLGGRGERRGHRARHRRAGRLRRPAGHRAAPSVVIFGVNPPSPVTS